MYTRRLLDCLRSPECADSSAKTYRDSVGLLAAGFRHLQAWPGKRYAAAAVAVVEYCSVTPSLIFVSTIVATTMRAPRGSSPAHSLAAPPSALRPPRMASDSPSGVQAGAEAPQSAPLRDAGSPLNCQAAPQQMQWERAADAPQSAHGAERAVVGRAARHPQICLQPERSGWLPCRAER